MLLNVEPFLVMDARLLRVSLLQKSTPKFHNYGVTEKEIVLETIRALPDDCTIDEVAERIRFMAGVQTGLEELDRGEEIPHEEVKKQLASWFIS
jgi:hypothetical protein